MAAYLDQGKPDSLVSYSRMKRFRDLLPGVIRPDIIPTEDAPSGNGMVITELDSVPGGIGVTGALARAYSDFDIVGGPDGMVQGFARMLRHHLGERTGCVAIVVSDEAQDYRPEMAWVARQLNGARFQVQGADFNDIAEGNAVYRFFELFDVANQLLFFITLQNHGLQQAWRISLHLRPAVVETKRHDRVPRLL